MATNYHIPNTRECNSCHNRNNVIVPIGTKLRTLNMEVTRNGRTQNQLAYFQSLGIMETFDPIQVQALPQPFDSRFTVAQQARAYLEINCSHCHSADGIAGFTNLHVPYATPLNQTGILNRKDGIVRRITTGEMPLLGTTIVHKEGLELIRNYINSLP